MNAEQDKQIKELEKAVTDAIKEKKNDLSFLEDINDEYLRYIQKFIEVEISNRATKLSIPSLLVGAFGIAISFIAIGVSFFLVGISNDSVTKIAFPIGGMILVILGLQQVMEINRFKKENVGEDIEFMHKIILEIERRINKL
ncbi:MAG: hypothetical protein KAT05_02020 [Spirochaetes bacterium]|nr:hypothetical protein [Spirochaetota bacterium]